MKPIEIALQEYGTHDIKGILNSDTVMRYFKEIGQKWVTNDDTAWCAAFVNWVLLKAKKQQTGSLSARSFMTYGTPTTTPNIGDIVILWRIYRDSAFGHVGFFIKEEKNNIYILGGNQNDEVNISIFPKARLLGYRQIPEISHA